MLGMIIHHTNAERIHRKVPLNQSAMAATSAPCQF
jgi:hypothetical protein